MGKHGCMDMKLGGWGQLIVDAENFEGQFKVITGHPRSNEVKWGMLMPNILKVTSRSSGVIRGQMRSNRVNIGVWT